MALLLPFLLPFLEELLALAGIAIFANKKLYLCQCFNDINYRLQLHQTTTQLLYKELRNLSGIKYAKYHHSFAFEFSLIVKFFSFSGTSSNMNDE